jgi:tetratricopeptide (TPR) repeat protein
MSRRLLFALPVVMALVVTSCSGNAADDVASGDKFVAEGKLPEAVIQYRNAIQKEPRLGDARLKLAKTYEQLNERANAGREYIRAADLLPDNLEAQTKAATVLLLSGQFEDAKTRAERALAIDAKAVDALIVKASAMANLKDLEGAIGELEGALSAHPDEPRMRGSLGVLEMAKGNLAEAEREFRHAVDLNPKNPDSHLALGAFLLRANRGPEAEQALLEAHRLDPKSLLANRALAVFYAGSNRGAQAEPFLKTLAEVMPDGQGVLALADYYAGSGRPAEARSVLESQLGNAKLFSDTRRRMAAILYSEKKPAEAHALIDEVLAKTPNDADALVAKARLQQVEGKREDAMRSAQAAVKANPNSVSAHYLVGQLHAASARNDEAIAAFTEVLRLNPSVAGAQLELARLNLTRRGGSATSVGYAEQVLARQPGHPIAQLTLVRGLLASGNVARAEREMELLVKRFPKAAGVQAQMGTVMLAKRDAATARQYYERALSLDPNSLDGITGLVTLDIVARRVDAARSRVNAKLAERPDEPRLIELAARTATAANDVTGAEQHLRHLIDIAPERLSAYAMLAQIYIRQQKLDAARAELNRVAAKQKRPVGPHTMIAMLYEQEGRLDEARKFYEQVLGYEPRAAVAANNLAWIMAERNENLDLALKYAQTAKEVLPEQAEVSDTLGWIYYKKDLPSMAVAPLQHAVEQDPGNPVYHYRLGLVYLKTGDSAKARQALQQALKLNPAFQQAADAKSKLAGL